MNECIEVMCFRDKDGYGKVSYRGKIVRAHRLAYCKKMGIDLSGIEGMVVLHSCDNPACTNPDHLSIGTQADNVADMVSKKRNKGGRPGGMSYKGEENGRAKLTIEHVNEIRKIYSPRCKENGGRALARRFDVDPRTIRCVVSGATWKI